MIVRRSRYGPTNDPRETCGRPAKKLRKSIMKDRRRYFDILLSNTMFLLHIRIQKETPNWQVRRSHSEHFSVNQLGLEPRTPSLKGMCSTCWATDSPTFSQKRVQRYCFFLKYANFLVKKMIKTHICWILWRGRKDVCCRKSWSDLFGKASKNKKININ